MCGIGGWLGHLGFTESDARGIAVRMRHRGPDGIHFRLWPGAALIHARLAIIDLSQEGDQPLGDESGTSWAVVNGEIYNHHALRTGLEQRGHRIDGRSDCAVVPHLYEERGAAAVDELRGMFALARYDDREKNMVLARDRFGIKPLFYSISPEGLVFASEIRALRSLPGVDGTVDAQALWDYTALLYVPAPRTIFTGVRALEPGHYIEASMPDGELRYVDRAYHRWAFHLDHGLSLDAAASRASELIDSAVASQLESDVPLGSLLSGGIDSSLVSAAAQQALGSNRLQTFNVRFPDAEYDETWAAHMVAKAIGSEHRTLDVSTGQAEVDHIVALLRHAGQPFADTSVFAVDAVSSLMRRHVTVALSGDGGDEAFGGYDFFWQLGMAGAVDATPRVLRAMAMKAVSARTFPRVSRLLNRMNETDWSDDVSIMTSLFSWIREDEQRRLLPDVRVESVRRHFEPQWRRDETVRSRLERLSALGTEARVRLSLPNDYLFKVDIASMRHGLEVRVPLLDEQLFTFGLSLPHRLKVRGKSGKRVLREVAERRLPAEVARKRKSGFGIPVDIWASPAARSHVRDMLLSSNSALTSWVARDQVKTLADAFAEGTSVSGVSRQGLYQRVIMLLAIHLVLDEQAAETIQGHAARASL